MQSRHKRYNDAIREAVIAIDKLTLDVDYFDIDTKYKDHVIEHLRKISNDLETKRVRLLKENKAHGMKPFYPKS